MKDRNKTKEQLINELAEMRKQIQKSKTAGTENKKMDKKLEKERNILRTLVDNLPDIIYAKDKDSRFILGNIVVANLMGVKTPNELIDKTDFDFYPKELAMQYYADEQNLIKSG